MENDDFRLTGEAKSVVFIPFLEERKLVASQVKQQCIELRVLVISPREAINFPIKWGNVSISNSRRRLVTVVLDTPIFTG